VGKQPPAWEDYLRWLEENTPYEDMIRSLQPRERQAFRAITVRLTDYQLYPWQGRFLARISGRPTYMLGIPSGLGKTYIAGAWLARLGRPVRVLFLVPTLALGVQQTLFARQHLLAEAYLVTSEMPPSERRELEVWNAPFVVATPQVFYNDNLKDFEGELEEAREFPDPDDAFAYLSEVFGSEGWHFPYDVVIADEAHNYIGQTAGHSVLLAARSFPGVKILGLSATPQLHDRRRLRELKRVFPDIRPAPGDLWRDVPPRKLYVCWVDPPPGVLDLYKCLLAKARELEREAKRRYGPDHRPSECLDHPLCRFSKLVKRAAMALAECGHTALVGHKLWKYPSLSRPPPGFKKSPKEMFEDILASGIPNHKFAAAERVLKCAGADKAIVFANSVSTALELGASLQAGMGVEDVAVLVGKSRMSMKHQARALLHFKTKARVLVATSVAEEGLDIPAADVEVWLDVPGNPRVLVQRAGRLLRPKGGRSVSIYALVTRGTHEGRKLKSVIKAAEKHYGFRVGTRDAGRSFEAGQTTLVPL